MHIRIFISLYTSLQCHIILLKKNQKILICITELNYILKYIIYVIQMLVRPLSLSLSLYKRAGIRARLQANPHRPTLSSLFLTNSCSLINKMDEIRLRITSHCMDSCVMIITETWLDSAISDAVIDLQGRTVYRADRTADSGKSKVPGAYKATLSPHLGLSDHISIEMIPSYRPLICRTQPAVKTVQVWNDEAISQLQDCFENTARASLGHF